MPEFIENWHMKAARLSALRIGRLYSTGNILVTHFCYRLCQPQGHNAPRRVRTIKSPNDRTGKRTRDLNQMRHRVPPNSLVGG